MIRVGTSGWQYDDWRAILYPSDLPKREWLSYFSERFPVVEVNNTFYRLPGEETFDRWRLSSASGFLFAIKASRYITHVRRLRDCRDPVRLLWSRCRRLKEKRGPILFQLPPNLPADPQRLRDFLRVLPTGIRAAFEFRHDSWETEDTRSLLDDSGCALVLADRPRARVANVATGGWSYVRFHRGAQAAPDYPRRKLRRWAGRLTALPAQDTFVFFNNDEGGAAVRDAATLARLLRADRHDVAGPDLPTPGGGPP